MTTRQEIHDRIRETSKDEYILDEMIRLGFWPRGGELPEDPAEEIRRRGELERQLRALTTENSRLQNIDAIKKAARKQRMEESKRKRKENRERRLRERKERAAAWHARKKTEIVYLGEAVSGGLNHQESDITKVQSLRLPLLKSANDIASAMDISLGTLRFLAFSRRTATVSHYVRFAMKKKTGGLRHISAPMPRLKRIQHWILTNILQQIPLHRSAHGFRPGRSIVTNAQPHVGSEVVMNLDLKDFFPTITYRRVKGMFRSFGYAESVATILALICTEPDTQKIQLDGQNYFVAQGERFLPQGAPTSPAITNVLCRGLDARLQHLAQQLGFRYTRYADDITFSGGSEAIGNVGQALRRVKYVVTEEGFEVHPDKTRVQRKGSRQEVTGLTVNERVNVPRQQLRKFRATLYQIEKDGPAGKRWGSTTDVIAAIEGFANFVAMIDPERGKVLQQRVSAIIERYGRGSQAKLQRPRWRPPVQKESQVATDLSDEDFVQSTKPTDGQQQSTGQRQPQASPQQQPKKKPWWKIW